MTLDELMEKRNGEWQDGFAVVMDGQGYYWRVAQKINGEVKLLKDAYRFNLVDKSPEPTKIVENVVESAPKKRGRKPAIELIEDELDI